MLPHLRRRCGGLGRTTRAGLLLAPLAAAALTFSACDKVPLLAPTGSTISLFASGNVLAPNGSLDLIATIIEGGSTSSGGTGSTTTTSTGGQPVHNGTLVTFTTTIGTITPNEARTNNGQVTVKLTGDGRSGVASIFAYSGGAKSAELKINVGSAAVDHVVLTADPQTLPPAGGMTQLSARVEDVSGNGLTGVDVTFSTTTGTIANATVKTNDSAIATTQLVTTQTAKVTATCGAKNASVDVTLSPRTGVSITPPSSSPSAGSPATFTVGVSSSANIRDVTVNWGDGTSTSLGAIAGSTAITHVFSRDGTYTLTATATDASGSRESVSTSVTVLPLSPVSVTLTASSTSPVTNQTVSFTATPGTIPAGTVILRYVWNFGDGSADFTSTSNSASTAYSTAGIKNISVRVQLSNGAEGTGNTTIVVTNPNPVNVNLSASPTSISNASGGTIVFTATVGSLPPGRSIKEFQWIFADGQTATTSGDQTSHTYAAGVGVGPKTVQVSVVLDNLVSYQAYVTITVT